LLKRVTAGEIHAADGTLVGFTPADGPPLAEDLDPLRPKHTWVASGLECVGHLSQKCTEVIAAEQVMELGNGTQVGAADLVERVESTALASKFCVSG